MTAPGESYSAGPAVVFDPGVQVGAAIVLGDSVPQITDTETAPTDGTPVLFRRGSDGLFRPDVDTGRKAAWSDPIRLRPGIPTDDPAAPEGAVQIDTTTGRLYRRRWEE